MLLDSMTYENLAQNFMGIGQDGVAARDIAGEEPLIVGDIRVPAFRHVCGRLGVACVSEWQSIEMGLLTRFESDIARA